MIVIVAHCLVALCYLLSVSHRMTLCHLLSVWHCAWVRVRSDVDEIVTECDTSTECDVSVKSESAAVSEVASEVIAASDDQSRDAAARSPDVSESARTAVDSSAMSLPLSSVHTSPSSQQHHQQPTVMSPRQPEDQGRLCGFVL